METVRASELRIGNLVGVSWNNIFSTVIEITTDDVKLKDGFATYNQLQPIPLTEEWLLKFGFEKNLNSNNIIYYILAGKCLLEYNLTHNIADIVKKVHLDLFIEIKYVHQLQNLYFALTCKELLLSLPQ